MTIYLQVVKSCVCIQAVCAEVSLCLTALPAQVGRGLTDQLELLSHKAEKQARCSATLPLKDTWQMRVEPQACSMHTALFPVVATALNCDRTPLSYLCLYVAVFAVTR